MAANLNGNTQSYQPFALRIFQGLKPDVVAIQEFNYGGNTAVDFRALLDTAFGTNFSYYREPSSSYSIPNGIISRYPIVAAGSWDDSTIADRGFAWAQLRLPGTNDLYVVSVHLYGTGSTSDRNAEATAIKSLVEANFPPGAWIVVAGDFNTDTRSESALTTFKTFLSDNPVPMDAESGGDPDTNEPRNKPYDYVLPSFSFAALLTNTVLPSHSFPNGLVFDSRLYTPLSDVAPVLTSDSGNAQHMAVLKDFCIVYNVTNSQSEAPLIVTQPQSQQAGLGDAVTFTATASGAAPLAYQWFYSGTSFPAAIQSSFTRTNIQTAEAGDYFVMVTNLHGKATSSVATLTVVSSPVITNQPQSLTLLAGQNAGFSVGACGASPLHYQWQFNGNPITGATLATYMRTAVQASDAGRYSVLVWNNFNTNASIDALLSVSTQAGTVVAQWTFNSVPGDADSTTGTIIPTLGTGTASLVGGTTSSFASGCALDTSAPTDNSGWNTTTYPAPTAGNKSAGVAFNVSTLGRQNIVIRWDQRVSNTGSKYARLQYSTNGTSFVDFPTAVSVSAAASFEPKTNDLSALPGVSNNPHFAFRIVAEFENTAANTGGAAYLAAASSSTYATAGTIRYDMVSVIGDLIPTATAPTITSPPSSQTVAQGSPATFSVSAAGTGPLSYQWRLNTTNISGATGSFYTRANVQPADAGLYSVLVTNSAGAALSDPAALRLFIPSPVLVTLQPGILQWQGLSNLPYTVQTSDDLGNSNWTTIATAISQSGNLFFTNVPGSAQKFYRVLSQ